MVAALIGAATTLPVSACTDSTRTTPAIESPGPYSADIKAAAKSASNDFEREVLSDGVITAQEYQEAVNRLVRCASDKGVGIKVTTIRGVNRYEVPTSANGDAVFNACSAGTTRTIESLYSTMVTNPRKEDEDELFATCIRRSGLAPASFTGDVARRIARSQGNTPYPFDTADPRFDACMTNPAADPPTSGASPS